MIFSVYFSIIAFTVDQPPAASTKLRLHESTEGDQVSLLRANADFRRLWTAQSVSDLGTQISMLGLPLIAVVTLHASTFQVGVLAAASSASWLLVGLLVGAWVDRMRRRPVMIVADLLRAGLLTSLVVAAIFGSLTLTQLYVVALGVGVCSVFFDVANPSYLPAVVGRDYLVEANARLQASISVAYTAGPTVAGLLVQSLTAPVAIVADAVSFVWSAAFVTSIRNREAICDQPACPSMAWQIKEGFAVVFGQPVLRAIALYNTTVVTFWSLERAIVVVFLVRTVHLTASTIGVLYSVASVGAIIGAFGATALSRRLGIARSLIAAAFLTNASMLLMPLTDAGWRLGFYLLANGVASCFVVAFNIVSMSYRQRVCPDHLLGRMNATMRFISWGSLPVGSLVGGWLGTVLGIRPTLWIGCAGGLLGVAWLVASPLFRGETEVVAQAESPELVRP
jgi:MFS family permease